MRILAATNNAGKLAEITRMLEPLGFSVVSPDDLDIKLKVAETGMTFAENAYIKARAFFQASGLPSLGDDSGLCVDALDGRPGLHSATYKGIDLPYTEKISALLAELKGVPGARRTARFVSALCLVMDEETVLTCEGVCEGTIGRIPAGEGGFGYDPIFYIGDKSFASLAAEEKDELSHRGKSLRKLAALLEESI